MEKPVFYYDAQLIFGKRGENKHRIIFKSAYSGYMRGDTIKKKFRSGAMLTIRILHQYGDSRPSDGEIEAISVYSCFPHVISED